jgi:urease accessory protein
MQKASPYLAVVAGLLGSVALASPAFAHAGHGDDYGLVHGFLHPLVGIDHLLAILTTGVIAAYRGGRSLWRLPLVFLAFMALGGIAGWHGASLPLIEGAIAASLCVLGGVLALRRIPSERLALPVVAALAAVHGYPHGVEASAVADGLGFAAGFLTATASLLMLAILTSLALEHALRDATYRQLCHVSGGIVALVGVGLIAGFV